jgi:hypothetical protein
MTPEAPVPLDKLRASVARKVPDTLSFLGAAALVYGTSQLSIAAAWMLGGMLVLAFGILLDRASLTRER